MIWFAWRQFRIQALIAFLLLVALAIAFLITGPDVLHAYRTTIVGCRAHNDCQAAKGAILSTYPFLQNLLTESGVLAVLIGIFWGAPVVAREFDTGTYRLAWTQSVSRTRWLAAKLMVGGLATVLTAGLFTLMATWWSSPIDRVRDQPFSLFDTRGIVPIGYALFAFTLGVAIGALVRRTIPAMVATIAAFAAVRLSFLEWVRPHLESPLHGSLNISSSPNAIEIGGGSENPGSWFISSVVKNSAGRIYPRLSSGLNFHPSANGSVTLVGAGRCPNKFPSSQFAGAGGHPSKAMQEALAKCVNSFHLHELVTYQPVSRYWPFQWAELGSYVALSALLITFSVWWIRRR